MVTNAPQCAKTYGDTKQTEGAGDRQGASGSWTCQASSTGTVPRVTLRHFLLNHVPCRSTAWTGSSLVGSTLVLCPVCQLPLTRWPHSPWTLLSALLLPLPGQWRG